VPRLPIYRVSLKRLNGGISNPETVNMTLHDFELELSLNISRKKRPLVVDSRWSLPITAETVVAGTVGHGVSSL